MLEYASCAANIAASVGSIQMVGSSNDLREGGIGQRKSQLTTKRWLLLKKELYKDIHLTPMFIASLLIITKLWKQPGLLMDKANVVNR